MVGEGSGHVDGGLGKLGTVQRNENRPDHVSPPAEFSACDVASRLSHVLEQRIRPSVN
jgi:hypothetical protein